MVQATDATFATVDKWADYEDELQQLRSQNATPVAQTRSSTPTNAAPDDAARDSPMSARASYLPVQSRLSSFLTSRKSTQVLPPQPTPSTTDLVAALAREQTLRQAAEGKLDESSAELEELSSQLFQQANEMVATERKARAKLEERVALLERRDGEKRLRLERLESAMQRIERVRGLLAPNARNGDAGDATTVEKDTESEKDADMKSI